MAVRGPCFYQIAVFGCLCLYYGVIAQAANIKATSPVPIESAPFVATLQGPPGRQCAASVVHRLFLLTAASCLLDDSGVRVNLTKALVGTNNLSSGGQRYNIATTLPHMKYCVHTGDYNIGLVKLADGITFGPKVGAIKLGKSVRVGDFVVEVGWGMKTELSGVLQEVSMPVLRKAECQQGLLGRIIAPRMLCAGVVGRKHGDCVGDEGGPVVVDGALVAVGSGSGCGRLPGLYTRVHVLRNWIVNTMRDN